MKWKFINDAHKKIGKLFEKSEVPQLETISEVKHPRTVMIRENRVIIALLSILAVIAIGFVLYQTRSIILPLALAGFISYVLNPMITFFEKRKIPTFFAIFFALIITFLFLNLFGMLIYTSIRSFASEFPK